MSAQEKSNAFSLEPEVIRQELKNESEKLFFSVDSRRNLVALKSPMAEYIDVFSNLSENSIQQVLINICFFNFLQLVVGII